MTTCAVKITFGQLREQGLHHIEVFCRDYTCSHSVILPADRWPDHVRLSDIEDQFVSTGAASEVRRSGDATSSLSAPTHTFPPERNGRVDVSSQNRRETSRS